MVEVRCYDCGRILLLIGLYGTIINYAKLEGMEYVGQDENGNWYCQACVDKKEKNGAKVIDVR